MTEATRTLRRELVEQCPKCGSFPQPKWKREGDIVAEFHRTGPGLLDGTYSKRTVKKECLSF